MTLLSADIIHIVLAAAPVIFLMLAILWRGWGVSKAAPCAMLLAALIAAFPFKASPISLAVDAGKGSWNALSILIVIWAAVFLYELSRSSGGFDAVRRGISKLTEHELFQILIFGWIFPSFLQGITGFGVAVAVGASLLLGIGMKPLYSIVTVLLCHCWGATFGTLALAWDALVSGAGLTGETLRQTALLSAGMIWIFNLACVIVCCAAYGGKKAVKEVFPAVAVLSVILGGGELMLAPLYPTLACFIPSVAGLGAAVLISRTGKYSAKYRIENSKVMQRSASPQNGEGARKESSESPAGVSAPIRQRRMSFSQAFLPYYILTAVAVICLLIPPVAELLGRWEIGFSFPEEVTGYGFEIAAEGMYSPMRPLAYAGSFLLLSALASLVYYLCTGFIHASDVKALLAETAKKCLPSTIGILSLLIMSRIMNDCGMIFVLAQGAAELLGRCYVFASPFFGMLGAFMTSSNMSSNILMSSFQRTSADLLGIDPSLTCSLQTVGAVLGDAFSPGCVLMGISTIGCSGLDGDIIKKVIPISLVFAVLYGSAALLVTVL